MTSKGYLRKVKIAYDSLGIIGTIRSAIISSKYTGSIDDLILTKNVIMDISDSANFEIESSFIMGESKSGMSHSDLCHSKLGIKDNASLKVPSSVGSAVIGPCSIVNISGEFSMGNSWINSFCRILCGEKIVIGNGCAIAWNVQMIDSDRHSIFEESETKPNQNREPIHVGNNVWIGHDVTIKKGVSIGRGSVIASNSVITRDVPESTLVAGIPGEVVKENIEWD